MTDRARILLVEDDVLIRLAMADVLRDEGYEVVEAANGDEALTVLDTSEELHLVITDIRMPGPIDGLAFAALVKDRQSATPVLVMSSHLPDDADRRFDQFLAKPFTFSALLDAVKELIGAEWKTKSMNRDAS